MSKTHQRAARKPASVAIVATIVTAIVTMTAAMTSGWRAPRRASGAGSGPGEAVTGAATGGGGGGAPVTVGQRRTGSRPPRCRWPGPRSGHGAAEPAAVLGWTDAQR